MRAILALGAVACVFMSANTALCEPASAGLQSYQKAHAVIDAAVKAIGGADALRSLHGVRRDLDDHWVDTGQQQHPWLTPVDAAKIPVMGSDQIVSYIDYSSQRWARSDKSGDGHGDFFTQTDAGDETGGFSTGVFHDEKPFYSTSDAASAAGDRAREIRRYPEGLLRIALEHPETLAWVGAENENGRTVDIVSLSDAQGARMFLYVDAKTHLLAKAEFLRDHPVYGDTWTDYVYDDYRKVGPLLLPYHQTDLIAGVPTHIYTANAISVSAQEPAGLLKRPAVFAKIIDPPSAPKLNSLGDGVYEILGPYNVMFAVFRDYVLLAEAPIGESYVESCLALIHSVAPNKPVHAVSTHFHFDHVGGTRALVARGIPILTTADAKAVIEKALTAQKTMHPDLYSRHPVAPNISVAESANVIDDGTQRVEIYDIGPSEHVAHMLIAYFPKQKTLLVADLWDVSAPEQAITGEDGVFLMMEIERLHLDVQRMLPVHGVPATLDEMKHGLAIRAKYFGGTGK